MEINLTQLHISKDVMVYLKFTLITFWYNCYCFLLLMCQLKVIFYCAQGEVCFSWAWTC